MSRWLIFIIYVALNGLSVWIIGSGGKAAFFECYYIGAALMTHYFSNRGD
jgi:hypothetical protein